MAADLCPFDLSNVKDDSVVLMFGKRATGKTALIKKLMNHDAPFGVIAATDAFHEYPDLTKRTFSTRNNVMITDLYTPEIPALVRFRQEEIARGISDPHSFLVLDDCLFDKEHLFDKNLFFLFENRMNLRLQMFVAMQYPMNLPARIMGCVDYVFLFRDPSLSTNERLYEQYGTMFPSLENFQQTLERYTQDHGVLVIDYTSRSSRFKDNVFFIPGQSP